MLARCLIADVDCHLVRPVKRMGCLVLQMLKFIFGDSFTLMVTFSVIRLTFQLSDLNHRVLRMQQRYILAVDIKWQVYSSKKVKKEEKKQSNLSDGIFLEKVRCQL